MNNQLHGLRVLLTRQEHDNLGLEQLIAQLGGISSSLPLFAVESRVSAQDLLQISAQLQICDLAICISKSAVQFLRPIIAQHLPKLWAAVGKGTAEQLRQLGITNIVAPMNAPYDSKALYRLILASNINLQNKYIMVFTGENGDNWLTSRLSNMHATVEIVSLYARIMPQISDNQIKTIFAGQHKFDVVVITCITSLVNLISVAGSAQIDVYNLRLLVVSERIFTYAKAQGFNVVYVAHSMSDTDILEALVTIGEENAKISEKPSR